MMRTAFKYTVMWKAGLNLNRQKYQDTTQRPPTPVPPNHLETTNISILVSSTVAYQSIVEIVQT